VLWVATNPILRYIHRAEFASLLGLSVQRGALLPAAEQTIREVIFSVKVMGMNKLYCGGQKNSSHVLHSVRKNAV
jgi:hypothetical protein